MHLLPMYSKEVSPSSLSLLFGPPALQIFKATQNCSLACTPTQVVEVNENQTGLCVRDAQRPTKSIECAFDRVFGPESVQEDVFLSLVPALDTVIKGFNACVLAYGQTGAGKTHTLIGTDGFGFLRRIELHRIY